jgi:hypothetical protein
VNDDVRYAKDGAKLKGRYHVGICGAAHIKRIAVLHLEGRVRLRKAYADLLGVFA